MKNNCPVHRRNLSEKNIAVSSILFFVRTYLFFILLLHAAADFILTVLKISARCYTIASRPGRSRIKNTTAIIFAPLQNNGITTTIFRTRNYNAKLLFFFFLFYFLSDFTNNIIYTRIHNVYSRYLGIPLSRFKESNNSIYLYTFYVERGLPSANVNDSKCEIAFTHPRDYRECAFK